MGRSDLDIPEFLSRRLTEKQRHAAWKKYKAPRSVKKEPTEEEQYWQAYEAKKRAARERERQNAAEILARQEAEKETRKREKLEALKANQPPREKSARSAMREGLVDIKVVAAEFKIKPGLARRLLKKAKFAKPGAWGWAFTDAMLPEVRKLVAAGLKAKAKADKRKKV
jgi:hypothetical protein